MREFECKKEDKRIEQRLLINLIHETICLLYDLVPRDYSGSYLYSLQLGSLRVLWFLSASQTYHDGTELIVCCFLVWGDFTNSQGIERSERQGRKGKIYTTKCRIPENCKERLERLLKWKMQIEENNRMGKTRDLFKKIGAIKGIFHARMGTIKDRNSKDLTEAEEI